MKWLTCLVLFSLFSMLVYAGGGGGGPPPPPNIAHKPTFSESEVTNWCDDKPTRNCRIADAEELVTSLGSIYTYGTSTHVVSCGGGPELVLNFGACSATFSLSVDGPLGNLYDKGFGPADASPSISFADPGLYKINMISDNNVRGTSGCHEYFVREGESNGVQFSTLITANNGSSTGLVGLKGLESEALEVMRSSCLGEYCKLYPDDSVHCEPDDFAFVCDAYGGATWAEEAQVGFQCCGDDQEDVGGFFTGASGERYICAAEAVTNNGTDLVYDYAWANATGSYGDVLFVPTPGSTGSAYEVMSNGVDWLSCGLQQDGLPHLEFNPGTTEPLDTVEVSPQFNFNPNHAYLCFQEPFVGGVYRFAECLGESGTPFNDNADFGTSRYAGEYVGNILEIDSYDLTQATLNNPQASAFTIGIPRIDTAVPFGQSNTVALSVVATANGDEDSTIVIPLNKSTVLVESLLFPLRYTNYLPLRIDVETSSGIKTFEDVLRYSTKPVKIGDWHYIQLPEINDLVTGLTLYFDGDVAYQPGERYTFWIGDIGVLERISKLPAICSDQRVVDGLGQVNEFYRWIKDRDGDDFNTGEFSCGDGAVWTGTQCCGDDGRYSVDGVNQREQIYGQNYEYYPDTSAGCWGGQEVFENQRIASHGYEVVLSDGGQDVRKDGYIDCLGTECEQPLPYVNQQTTQVTVSSNTGNITLNDGITSASTTTDPNAQVRNNGPFNVLYNTQEFFGCMESPQIEQTDNQGQPVGIQAVTNLAYEFNISEPQSCHIRGPFYCSPEGYWSDDVSQVDSGGLPFVVDDFTHYAETYPGSGGTAASCCPQDFCWNGTSCVYSVSGDTQALPVGGSEVEGYRCVDGFWQFSNIKKSWDARTTGFCPNTRDCFVGYETPGSVGGTCVSSGESVGDFFCAEGAWITRTKITAEILMEQADSSEYTLFCDTASEALNYLDRVVDNNRISDILTGIQIDGQGGSVSYACSDPLLPGLGCVNNFCVLKQDDRVLLGTSLNTVDTSVFSEIFEISCLANGDQLAECGNDFFYQESNNLLFYLPTGTPQNTNIFVSFLNTVFSSIQAFFGVAEELGEEAPLLSDRIRNTTQYNTIYFASTSDVALYGLLEQSADISTGQPTEYLVVYYTGLSDPQSVCDAVNKYNATVLTSVDCTVDSGEVIIGSSQPLLAPNNIVDQVWKSVTAELRPE